MKAISLFGRMLTFSRLKINTDNLQDVECELQQLLGGCHNESIPIVIDSSVKLDLAQLIELLWSFRLQPIGVVEGALTKEAEALRLATFPADGKRIKRLNSTEETLQTTEQSDIDTAMVSTVGGQSITSVIHGQLVRSGQSLQHLGGDLIIMGGVNAGAEAITDSNLHVYGRGLGRLVAGATGDKEARIFCQKFNPSLVSVAGTYCLSDAIPAEMIDKAVQVSYDEEKGLVFSLLTS